MDKDELIIEQEAVTTISNKDGLFAVIRRNPVNKIHQASICRDAVTEDLVSLIRPGFKMPDGKTKKEN